MAGETQRWGPLDDDLAAETGVEIAIAEGSKEGSDYVITMRDAKDPDSPTLVFTPAEWDAFVAGVKDGEFDLDDEGEGFADPAAGYEAGRGE